ncbi:alpha/beta hydrolase [Leucobacter chromiireducens]|uniref:Alpha/beta hydrolase n=1 Tax=Leucobacter chromiireducens subsp. chromiireducens TaxID=660067 RepID=A0ABS1SQI4_9MICO|nr:alpha/beta hydrolase [Leucobacter chromiireducens]MBL3690420.1 alpha/beta hydrolase [Leucobacter chromiireducens subsp. chromiireducens]
MAAPDDRRSVWRRLTLGGAALAAAALLAGCSLIPGLGGAGGGSDPKLPAKPTGDAQSFQEQEPEWQPCASGMRCADVYAPLDWSEPEGETITLRLVKSEATGGVKKLGTLFVNPGGPGASGAEYVANAVEHAVSADVRAAYDVIGWDPRGVGNSAPVECLDTKGMDEYLYGDDAETADLERGSDAWIDAARAQAKEFAQACEERNGDLLAHVATSDTVQDLDMLRGIVGDAKLNYLGFSYGTYIGARYADAYPERVGRLVLDGAMDPEATMRDVVREQTIGFENALRAYTTDCLQRRGCPLTGSVDEAMAQIGALLDRVDANSLTGKDGRTVSSGVALTAIVFPLYSQEMWGYFDQLFTSLAVDDPEMALILADAYNDRQDGEYQSNSTEAFSAINCLDYPNELDVQRMRDDAAELAQIAPTIGRYQGYGDISCAEWPVQGVAERTPVTAAGADPILVVGTTGDPATPYRWAESLATQLESGTLVTYVGEGHTAYTTSSCVGEVVDAYFLDGTVPAADPRCTV